MTRLLLPLVLAACSDAGVTKFNTDPTAEISSHSDGDTVLEGYPVTLRGTVGDANHPIESLSASWLVSGVPVCADAAPDATGLVLCEHSFSPDAGEVLLEVRDPEGGSGSTKVVLQVEPTESPVAEISTPVPDGLYYSDHLITLEGTVSDAEDDPSGLAVEWRSSVDGVLSGDFTEVGPEGELLGASTLSEGEHFLSLTAVDSTGKQGTDNVTITVGPPNSVPTCSILSPADGTRSQEGSEVEFVALVDDADVSPSDLSVTWSSDKQGELAESSADGDGNVVFYTSDLIAETHVISLAVSDEVGATCVAQVTYTAYPCPIHVEIAGTPGANGSLAQPFGNIEDAIASAGECLQVQVGPGNYRTGGSDWGPLDLQVTSTGGASVTSLEGNGSAPIFQISGGQSRAALVDGFTFSGGYGALVVGGGSEPIVRNNVFENNQKADASGGAIHVSAGAEPEIYDNAFENNVGSNGGAIAVGGSAVPLIRDNTFFGNSSRNGGAIYNSTGAAVIRDNIFESNESDRKGGAVSNHSGSTTVIVDNDFIDNVSAYGGAVHCHSSDLTMSGNSYSGNSPSSNHCSGCTGCGTQ